MYSKTFFNFPQKSVKKSACMPVTMTMLKIFYLNEEEAYVCEREF